MVVARGVDQTQLSTRFETRDDADVLRNYGALLVQESRLEEGCAGDFKLSYSFVRHRRHCRCVALSPMG